MSRRVPSKIIRVLFVAFRRRFFRGWSGIDAIALCDGEGYQSDFDIAGSGGDDSVPLGGACAASSAMSPIVMLGQKHRSSKDVVTELLKFQPHTQNPHRSCLETWISSASKKSRSRIPFPYEAVTGHSIHPNYSKTAPLQSTATTSATAG